MFQTKNWGTSVYDNEFDLVLSFHPWFSTQQLEPDELRKPRTHDAMAAESTFYQILASQKLSLDSKNDALARRAARNVAEAPMSPMVGPPPCGPSDKVFFSTFELDPRRVKLFLGTASSAMAR